MRILIIEDDEKVGAFLKKGLKEEQYAVDLCQNGEDGLYYARVNDYDAIILDIMLPKMDGLEVCRKIRSHSIDTPIIMLTARDSTEEKVHGLYEGADDYLTKPFSFEELLARIRALMRRNQGYKQGMLISGNLQLDPYKRVVIMEGKEVELTGKEFSLLEYLLRNKGRVLSQTKIMEHVWDMNYIGDSNIVNVYINHLRDKIDRGKGKKLIHTIRGCGYKLDEMDEV